MSTFEDQQIQAIENQIERDKSVLAKSLAFSRLKSNRDFKEIVLEGFLKEEAIRLVHLKALPEYQTPERQAAVLRDIDAIGTLSEYFRTLETQGDTAKHSIESAELVLDELRQGNE